VENATSDVSEINKSPTQLEQDMFQTRESITEKVAALENQVIGTIQTAADTVTDAVDSVKEAVTSAPTAVSDTLKETVQAVKDTWHNTVGSFSVSRCVRNNAGLALGPTILGGFVIGYGFSGRRVRRSLSSQQLLSPDARELLERPVQRPAAHARQPSLIDGWLEKIGAELRSLGEEAMDTAIRSLKQNIKDQVPAAVESAVHQITDPIRTAGVRGRPSHAMPNGR
jgi:uncharacterized protein YoxC